MISTIYIYIQIYKKGFLKKIFSKADPKTFKMLTVVSLVFYDLGDLVVGEKIIGYTVVFAAFVFLPIFLYHRWKGKRLKDYTLSEENLKKIRKNIENQVVSKNKPR